MNNYDLSRLIVDDIMKKVNAGEQVFYMEYVRSVETLLNKHAVQQNAHLTGIHCPACMCRDEEIVTCARCGTVKSATQVA